MICFGTQGKTLRACMKGYITSTRKHRKEIALNRNIPGIGARACPH